MCLSHSWPLDRVKGVLPKDEFVAYKLVNRIGSGQSARLVSPVYKEYVWMPGDLKADTSFKSNGDAGFYVMLVPPGAVIATDAGRQILRLRVKPEHVLAGGPDSLSGHESTCLVVSECRLDPDDHELALKGDAQRWETEKTLKEARKAISKAKKGKTKGAKKVAKKKAAAKKLVKKVKKRTLMDETVAKLKAAAKGAGITGISKMTKDLLVKALKKKGIKSL